MNRGDRLKIGKQERGRPVFVSPLARLRTVPWAAARDFSDELVVAIQRVLDGAAAEKELDSFLRAHRGLDDQGRAACAESIFGVGLWRRRLKWHADSEVPRRLWAALMSVLGGCEEAFAIAGVAPFVLREGEPESIADRWSAPDWLVEELGSEADAFLRAFSVPGPVFLRANTLLNSRDELQRALSAEGIETEHAPIARDGLRVVSPRPNLYGSSSRAGFEVQDEGSQLLGELLEAQSGETVLDYCAGAGGKTLQLACHVGKTGRVAAWDVDKVRLERLRVRAEKARAINVRVLTAEPSTSGELFDRVLVDAPCSELGALRRGPDLRWRMDPTSFASLPALQLEILEKAARTVKPGGRLVYATCTTRRAENEEVAEEVERRHPEFKRLAVPAQFDRDGFFRVTPHVHGTDAFFAASYVRAA